MKEIIIIIVIDPEKLNSNEKNNGLSSLAHAGKNVIELTGENEMIPIINNNIKNEDDKLDINKLDVINEERKNEENKNKKSIELFKKEIERNKILYDDMDKPCTMEDLYKELNIIENINQNFSPINKIETLKNNFDIDYGDIKKKEKKQKNRNKSKFV